MAALALPADRPRERLFAGGVDRLADAELLALVLGAGVSGSPAPRVAEALLLHTGGITALSRSQPAELLAVAGVGAARAARLAAAFELGRRGLASADLGGSITDPEKVYNRLRPRLVGVHQEIAVVLALSAQNRVLAEIEIGRGEVTGVPVHPREVFRPLIRHGAAGGVLAHNHPSGDPTPSNDDIALTRRLCAAGDLVGIPLLDHVVIASGGFRSIAETLAAEPRFEDAS